MAKIIEPHGMLVGGTAKVFPSFDQLSGKRMALKVIEDPSNEWMLTTEYAVLKQLTASAYFPTVFGLRRATPHGQADPALQGKLMLTEEWLSGGVFLSDLMEAVKGTGLPARVTASITFDVLSAFSILECAGWLHRDPHPGNIYVLPALTKIIDLGCALRAGTDDGYVVRNCFTDPDQDNATFAGDLNTVAAGLAAAYMGTDERPTPDSLPNDELGVFFKKCLTNTYSGATEALVHFRGLSCFDNGPVAHMQRRAYLKLAAITKK